MIDPAHWQHEILSYAELLQDDRKIFASWINGDRSQTSVTDYYELYEQIFDDLDSDTMVNDEGIDPRLLPYIVDFLACIKEVDEQISCGIIPNDSRIILKSKQWERLRSSAQALKEAGLR